MVVQPASQPANTRYQPNVVSMLVQRRRRSSVEDGGPTLKQHWVDTSCLLGRRLLICTQLDSDAIRPCHGIPSRNRRPQLMTGWIYGRQPILVLCKRMRKTTRNNPLTTTPMGFSCTGINQSRYRCRGLDIRCKPNDESS